MAESKQKVRKVACAVSGGLLALSLWVTGCQANVERLNAPPQGASERPSELQDPFLTMTDNAILEDMSVSAGHFVPRQFELNGTGARRLKRMAPLLKVYGGEVHYTGFRDSDQLVQQRIEQIREFLLAEGVESDSFEVVLAMAGGEGMDADEAIEARKSSRQGSARGASTCPDTVATRGR
jgi:hypothetical protein